MNLVESTIGVDSGLLWEQNLNASLDRIDQHNHTSGNGIKIPPSGLNINASLPMNNNPLISINSLVFSQQLSLATLNSLFVGTDGNLYFNDGAGDPSIQITSAGAVNATSSGIVDGASTASFVSSVLVVDSAPNIPANIKGASLLLGNNVLASHYLTLSPPAAMASDFTLTFPSLPASEKVLALDSSGNFQTNFLVPGSQIANLTITAANIANNTITATQIANLAIGTSQIAAQAVTAAKIANGTVTATQIAANTITGSEISSSVNLTGVPKVLNLAIVTADNSVGANVIYGIVDSAGTAIAGSGFTSSRLGVGLYRIVYDTVFSQNAAAVYNSVGSTSTPDVTVLSTSESRVQFSIDTEFTFVCMGRR